MLGSVNRFLLASFRWHQFVFILALAAMAVIDFVFLAGWATFWVMVSWSMAFGVHFMVFRSQVIDEAWFEERLIFDVLRPWDYGHIDDIKNDPHGRSIYRTELGRVDADGKPVKPRDTERS